METLFEVSNRLINNVVLEFKRSIHENINWNQRLIEINGSRGIGKTTLMLQRANELSEKDKQSVIYVALDDSYFFNNSITETAENFFKYGGKYMFIDEVHKYPAKYKGHDWSAELKNIYDLNPELNIVYTGSSIIELHKGNGDLSRRKSSYTLNGLSFREYLEMNNLLKHPILSLNDILDNHLPICNEIATKTKILPHFQNYLLNGFYPFYNEAPENYFQRIKNVINAILEVDIPSVTDITFETTGKIKKLLSVLASTVPYVPNLTNLSANLNITDLRTLYKYLGFLEKAELISFLNSESKGNKIFQKPEKIFLNNTNIIYALTGLSSDKGTLRETFFCNQLKHSHELSYPKSGDFLVDKKYVFEIGGKNKTKKQIREIEKSFIAIDNAETGFANKIPLWLFGFLY
ncbi:MAG: AAA family ATPase [Bacteroidetes bacterium]|nr:AAA family ATPase [Bacteroidota bacterium]